MGTRINALFKHDLGDNRGRDFILTRLASTLPAAIAVKDYWAEADPQTPHDTLGVWREDAKSNAGPNTLRFTAPGSLFLTIAAAVASIRAGGRWRGFLSIAQLRSVHVTALRQIASALGARSVLYFPDSCEVHDLFLAGRSFEDCTNLMRTMWGPPLENLDGLVLPIDVDGPDVFATWISELL